MRVCQTATIRTALASLACIALIGQIAQAQPLAPRGQARIIEWNAQAVGNPTSLVGIVGQVQRPGTYRFPGTATLQQLIGQAGGLTENASPMLRVIRNQHGMERLAFQPGGQDVLRSGDLIVVDRQLAQAGARQAQPENGVQLAFLGLLDHPVVVKVTNQEARPDIIIEMLGQPPQTAKWIKTIPPPGQGLDHHSAPPNSLPPILADATVLVFDQSRIQKAGLQDLMPEILNCAYLPENTEQPDIVGYGGGRGLEPKLSREEMAPQLPRNAETVQATPETPAGESFHLVPPPPAADWDALVNLPAPIPSAPEKGPAFSTAGRSGASSAPVSRIPYTEAKGEPAESSHVRRTEQPRHENLPHDAREPAWPQIASRAENLPQDDMDDLEAAADNSLPGPLSAWQMSAIIACAGLLVGLALIIRRWQDQSTKFSTPAVPRGDFSQPSSSRIQEAYLHSADAISAPHFLKQTQAVIEPLALRQQRFQQLVSNELAVLEEPLSLRPGLRLQANQPSETIRRQDAAQHVTRPHVMAAQPASEPLEHAAGDVRKIDPPHAESVPAPHFRSGISAPVERALRQLEGGRA